MGRVVLPPVPSHPYLSMTASSTIPAEGGIGPKAEQFPQYVRYLPSGWELMVLVFALAVMLALYTLGERYLRLNEAPAA